jgi:hypothetical protein
VAKFRHTDGGYELETTPETGARLEREDTMKKAFGLFVVALLFAMPAAAQKVQIDYDRTVDFSKYETFAWAYTPETSLEEVSPLMHSRLKNAIEDEFGKGGARQVDEDPDVYITYHTNSKEEVRYNTTHMGYGYGGGWYWGGGLGSSTTTAYTYERGTLIIDIWDAKTKNMVWRGVITATVKANPEKNAKLIDKGVEKLSKKWQKMKQGQ